MKKKMAFIYMSNYIDWPLGGMLEYVKNIIPRLSELYDIDIFGCSVDGTFNKIVNINDSNYKIIEYTDVKTFGKIIPNFIISFFNTFKITKLKEYDIIYSHTSATTIASFFKKSRKAKLIHHQHGLSYKTASFTQRFLGIGYTVAQLLADKTLFVCGEDEIDKHKKLFPKRYSNRFFSIGSPINWTKINQISETVQETNQFIYTGRIDEHKNILLLIDSFNLYIKKYNGNEELILVGDGPQRKEVEEKIERLNLNNKIHLIGRKKQEEVFLELSKSKLFLFPSKGEGMSLSVLEAMAAGLPIVGFEVMGMKNIVEIGKNGILTESQTAESFCKAIVEAYNNRDIMSLNAKKYSEKYDTENIVRRIYEILEKNEINAKIEHI